MNAFAPLRSHRQHGICCLLGEIAETQAQQHVGMGMYVVILAEALRTGN